MQYRKLGKSDLRVSVLAFGAWQIGDPAYWGAESHTDETATVHAAIDAGINLFDTAEMYGAGQSEEALGRALGSRRERVLIASKVSPQNCAPELLRQSCETSLRRLGTDRIDLYQVHWPSRDVPFAETYEALARLQQEGKIREIGVSNFGAADLSDWLAAGACVSDQLGYNLLFRAVEHDILPACERNHVGVLTYMPLLQGILTHRWKTIDEIPPLRRRTRHFSSERSGTRHGEAGCEKLLLQTLDELDAMANSLGHPLADIALAWLMAQPAVTSVIIGARNPAQLKRNTNAADLQLDTATLSRLDEITTPLKDHFGNNADMWQGKEGNRIR